MNHRSNYKFNRSAGRKSQQGFSNVQIAIGILVGVIILLGSLGGFQYVEQAKVNNEVAVITDLKSATVRYAQFAAPFTADNTTDVILNGQNFFRSAGISVTGTAAAPVITNQWGGAVTVAQAQSLNAGDSIDFTFTSVPNSICNDIATKLDNVVARIEINGTETKAVGNPTNPATVTTQCAASVIANANTLVYRIQR